MRHSVRGLLEISKGINSELDTQDEYLTNMKRDLASTRENVEHTEERTQNQIKNSSRCRIQ